MSPGKGQWIEVVECSGAWRSDGTRVEEEEEKWRQSSLME